MYVNVVVTIDGRTFNRMVECQDPNEALAFMLEVYDPMAVIPSLKHETGQEAQSLFPIRALPARLDANGDAKPLTRILSHPKLGWCVGPGSPLHHGEYEDEQGHRIPLF